MLYAWLYPLAHHYSILNIFRYITFRTGGAILTTLLISFLFGKPIIRWLKSKQGEGQPIRTDGPESHLVKKKGTPTMGGCLILLAVTVSTVLWADWSNPFIRIVLIVTLGFGALGAYDDYLKLTKRSHAGMPGRLKLLGQVLISLIATYCIVKHTCPKFAHTLAFPFVKDYVLDMGYWYYPWAALVIVGASNAVNLTDGLDGLAIVPVMIAAACFCIISYVVGSSVFSNYLQIRHVAHTGELSIFLGTLIGAGLGFLWFNAPPAKVFMGDTGSLAAGGALGVTAVIVRHEIVLAIVGGLFVLEAVSVIIQVVYFKLTRKRIFLMAPIHHHFEKKGWAEPTVVIRFWIIASILALVGLSTLKLR
ncbi:MAG: phospho-N-acetylmuramoyl-pentapeptide-transferase [Alphaproteobacteria bacterium]|nr:phospho-N-acetylmuramoyl-pentapeptide-transferase [Alphaproteobacteria bacterium]